VIDAAGAEVAAVYADGGVIGANPSQIGGTWAYCYVDADGDRLTTQSGIVVPSDLELAVITNNLTEMLALLNALEPLPHGWSGQVYSDSMVTLGRLFKGWKMTGIPYDLQNRARRLVAAHLGQVTWIRLDGHPSREHLASGIGPRGGPVSVHQQHCDLTCARIGEEYRAARLAGQPS
jgi:ribonuclease HI